MPEGGILEPGDIVEFCITISNYQSPFGAQFMDGVSINFDPCVFDVTNPISTTSPASCSGSGTWAYYPNGGTPTGANTLPSAGPGWYFAHNTIGNPAGQAFSSWGDSGGCPRTFCITLEVILDPACGTPGDLNGLDVTPTVNVWGDGDTGSWGTSSGCCLEEETEDPLFLNTCDAEPGVSPGTVDICNNGPFDLFTLLGEPVQDDGFWTPPSGVPSTDNSFIFDPLNSEPGAYVYTVEGSDGCQLTSTIIMQLIDLGLFANVVTCDPDPTSIVAMLPPPPFPPFPDPSFGGTWTDPNGVGIPTGQGQVDPITAASGLYTYEFLDGNNCPTSLTVNASFSTGSAGGGENATIDVCTLDPPFQPFEQLGGNPLPSDNATWLYEDNNGVLLNAWVNQSNPTIDPSNYGGGNPMVSGYMVYFSIVLPCPLNFDTLFINAFEPQDAGQFTNTTLCVSDPPVLLEDLLDGTPDFGGTWINLEDPGMTFPGNILNPADFTPPVQLILEYTIGLEGTLCQSTNLLQLNILPTDADAGEFAEIDVCSSDPGFCMTDFLGGTPQPGGVWTDPFGTELASCLFNPASSEPGTYTYTITSPCDTDSQTLEINVIDLADPGEDGILEVCSDATDVPLIDGLGGSPAAGGTWTLLGETDPVAPTVDGATVVDGAQYTYTVGSGDCAASATVTISIVEAPFAGVLTDDEQLYCANDVPFSLNDLFTTAPSEPGTWTGPGTFTGSNVNPASAASGTYTHTVESANCGSDAVSIDIEFEEVPNAGTDSDLSVCPNGTETVNLLDALGGAAGGSWTAPAGGPETGSFDPGDPAGIYTYTLESPLGACEVSADLNVTYTTLPDPGEDGSMAVCESNAPFTLFGQLGGTPATGGTWVDPNGDFFGLQNVTLNPANHASGLYTYQVTAAGCPAVTSIVDVSILPDPDAGEDNAVSLCANMGSIDLSSYLGGTPDIGLGTWIENPLDISGMGGTTNVYTFTVDNGVCVATADLTLTVEELPNAGGDGDTELCSTAACFDLSDLLVPPFDAGGDWTDGNGDPATNNQCPAALDPGANTFTYTVGGTACPSATAEVTVNISEPPVAINVEAVCEPSQLSYIVSFEVSGGTEPIEVNGTELVGTTFTSDPIPTGDNYSFTIVEASTCDAVVVSGISPDCACPATATFASGDQLICQGETAFVSFDVAGDGPFDLLLNDGTDNILIEDYEAGELVGLDPANTTTYTLVSVEDQNCLTTAAGALTVTVDLPVSAGIDVSSSFCGTGGNIVLIDLLDASADLGGGFLDGDDLPVTQIPQNAASSGTYTYLIDGGACPDDQAAYQIDIFAPLQIENLVSTCEANQSEYTVSFTITGGNPPYNVNGDASGANFTSAIIPAGDNFAFAVSDNSPCPDATVNGSSPNCDCPASASLTGAAITVCQGSDIELNLTLDGVGPWDVVYNNGIEDIGPITLTDPSSVINIPNVQESNVYTLVSVEDSNCLGNTSGSISVTVDEPNNAGDDVSDILCGDIGNLSLMTLLAANADAGGSFFDEGEPVAGNSVPNNSGSSGSYTYVVDLNTCPADEANYELTIHDPISVSNLVVECNLAQTEYTVSFDVIGGSGNYMVNGNPIIGNSFTSDLLVDGYSFGITDDGPCSPLTLEDDSPDCECLAEGSLSGSTNICAGSCTDLVLTLSGIAPFSVSYENSNDPGTIETLTDVFNGQTISVCPGSNATYTLVSVNDANCAGTVVGDPVEIVVDQPVTVSNITQTCDDTGDNYVLSFEVSGGVAPIVVTPPGGNLTGGVYTLNLSSGSAYNLTLTDAGACNPVSVSGNPFTCPCTSEAGSISAADTVLCTNETLQVISDGNSFLDGNDTFQFALHDGSTDELGNILLLSADGNFTWNESLETGVSYVISALVGNEIGAGNVDLNDPCLSVSQGIEVLFNPLPTASFSGDVTVCEGDDAELIINFTGTGPWTFGYSLDGTVVEDGVQSASNSFTITTNQQGTYTIHSIGDALCTGEAGAEAVVEAFEVPTAVIEIGNDGNVCEGSGDGPQITFTGTAPWTYNLMVNGQPEMPVTTSSNPTTVAAFTSGTYELDLISDANCIGTVSGSAVVQLLDLPTGIMSGGGVVCQGDEADFNVNLTGEGPWTVQYTVDGIAQPALNSASPFLTFSSGSPGTYAITAVSDANCTGFDNQSNASLQVNPLPQGQILTNQNLVCEGGEVDITFDIQGNAPFDLTYVLNGDTLQVNGVGNSHIITLTPEEPVFITLISAADGSKPQCFNEINASSFIQTTELPNAPELSDKLICAGSDSIRIGVSPAPGLQYSWSPTNNLSDPNSANPLALLTNSGINPRVFTYVLTATSGDCTVSDTTRITVDPGPQARFIFSPEPALSEDPVIYFENRTISTENTQFFWNFGGLGSSNRRNPQFKFPEGVEGEYMVILDAIDSETGCNDRYQSLVRIEREVLIYVPNAFTPDGDGKNELWGPVSDNLDPDRYLLVVHDRAGGVVFKTRNIKEKWNGSLMNSEYYLPPGVYWWVLEAREKGNRDDIKMQGYVVLIR